MRAFDEVKAVFHALSVCIAYPYPIAVRKVYDKSPIVPGAIFNGYALHTDMWKTAYKLSQTLSALRIEVSIEIDSLSHGSPQKCQKHIQ